MRKPKLKLSKGAGRARIKFQEEKHKRDIGGKFADMPGDELAKLAGKATSKADWQATAKKSGIEKTDQIRLQVTSNPKKPGSNSAARFENYENGITVNGFLKAGGKRTDLAWDNEKGFITIHAPADYKRLAGVETPKVPQDTSGINGGASGHLAAIKAADEAKAAAAMPKAAPQKPGEAGSAPKPATVPPAAPKPAVEAPKPEKPKPAPEPISKKGLTYDDDEIIVLKSGQKVDVGEIKQSGKFKDADIEDKIAKGEWFMANPKKPPKSEQKPEPAKPPTKVETPPTKVETPPTKVEPKPDEMVTFTKGGTTPETLNGVVFKKWTPPKDNEGWAAVDGQMKGFVEPPLPPGKISSGVIITEPDGRVWVVKPTNAFGGYQHTFPKGTVQKSEGLSLQANAIKETYEESGLKVKITGLAGDFKGDTGTTRYYHATREGGTPLDHGWESEAVILAPKGKLDGLLNKQRDKDILNQHILSTPKAAPPKPVEAPPAPAPKPAAVAPAAAPAPAPAATPAKALAPAPEGPAPVKKEPWHTPKEDTYRYKGSELKNLPPDRVTDEGEKGLKWEYDVEYIKYGGQNWGPGIKDQADFTQRYKDAPLTYLTDDQFNNLGYTSINTNKLRTYKEAHDELITRRKPDAIRDRMLTGLTTPPIVLKKGNQLRLMAGQSRLFVGMGIGVRVPVKIIDVTPGKGVEILPPKATMAAAASAPASAAPPKLPKVGKYTEADVEFHGPNITPKFKAQFVERMNQLPSSFVAHATNNGASKPRVYRNPSELPKEFPKSVRSNNSMTAAFYSPHHKQTFFFETKSAYAAKVAGPADAEQYLLGNLAHELGHAADFKGSAVGGIQFAKEKDYITIAEKVRTRWRNLKKEPHEKWVVYFTSDRELWAVGTEAAVMGGRAKISGPDTPLGKIIREEGLVDYITAKYKAMGVL